MHRASAAWQRLSRQPAVHRTAAGRPALPRDTAGLLVSPRIRTLKVSRLSWSLALVGAAMGIAFALPTPAVAAPTPQLPLRDFFRNPEQAYFGLSDDGRCLGTLQPAPG